MSLGNLIYSNLKKVSTSMRKIWDNKMIIWTQNEMLDVRILFSCPRIHSDSQVSSTFYLWSFYFLWQRYQDLYTSVLTQNLSTNILFINVVMCVYTCCVEDDPIHIALFCIPCTAPIFDKLLLSDAIFGQWFC